MTHQLEFGQLDIAGFRSFVEPASLDLAGMQPGLHFVSGINELEPALGSNGAGKSSIWNALAWCLYGKTVNGLRRNDVRSWFGDTDTAVAVSINGHAIERTSSNLTINGEAASQQRVEEVVGLPFEVFTHTVLLGQGEPLFFDLPPRDKLALLASVLDLERWDRRSQAAGARANSLQGELYGIDRDLAVLKSQQSTAETQLARLEQQQREWEQELKRRLDTYETELADLQASIDTAQRTKDDADLALDWNSGELRALHRQIPQVEADLEVAKRNLQGFVIDDHLKLQDIERLKTALKSDCPTCGQPLPASKIAETKAKIERLTKQRGVPKISYEKEKEFTAQLARLKQAELDLQVKVDAAQDSLNYILPQLAAFQAKLATLKSLTKDAANQPSPYRDQLQHLHRTIQQAQTKLTKTESLQALLQRRLTRAQFWMTGFKELKLLQIEQVLTDLELMTNSMLPDIGLADWTVRYSLERETQSGTVQRGINVMILSPYNEGWVRWQAWSGGEAQRLRLVSALALSETLLGYAGVQTNLEIIDEPTQHLSEEGIGDLLDFLAERAGRLDKRLVLMDQHALPSGRFAGVLTVIKGESGSRIEAGVAE